MKATRKTTLCALALTAALGALPSLAEDSVQVPTPPVAPAAPAAPAVNGAEKYFGDLPKLLDQDGRPVHLYGDLMKGKVVVIDAIFTTCPGACPVMSRNFAKIQDWLGDRLGKDAFLISISVDPETDTPARLKEYAGRFNARPGWYFLTGSKEDVGAVLKKLGQFVAKPDDHSNLFLIGNDTTGLWKKAFGLSDAGELIPIVDSVLNDRG